MAKKVYVMGSLVLDIVPRFRSKEYAPVTDVFAQGKVTELNSVAFYMGGCVGNTGLAMHKLGADTTLCGKVGDDFAGRAIKMLISEAGAPYRLMESQTAPTACGIGMTPPGIDKITLFLKGAAQQYDSGDVRDLGDADLFHFGYPVTMKSLYDNGGAELTAMYKAMKERGASTSLDTALPRPDGEHGFVVWRPILERTLPYVDMFVPSYEECLFMLDRKGYIEECKKAGGADIIELLTPEKVRWVAESFLDMGAKIVLIKLGKRGAYLRTRNLAGADLGRALCTLEKAWSQREMWIFPNKVTDIVSATGAGDTMIAGFLASAVRGEDPEKALCIGTASASLCLRSSDTTSLLKGYESVEKEAEGAERTAYGFELSKTDWHESRIKGLYIGQNDRDFV